MTRISGSFDFLIGGGEMGRLVQSMDWSTTPLGAIEGWPQSLRTAVSLCLASNFPISMAWGPKHVQIYNDGYWPICGAKHPHSMGQDFRECWASAWPAISDAFESALAGQSAYLENQRMFLDRYGYLEETFFTFSFSPIRDESGGVGGLFHPVTEVTAKNLSERRTRALRDLASKTGKAKSVDDVFSLATQILAECELDLPFVLFYAAEIEGTHGRLASATGLPADSPLCAPIIHLDAGAWPLGEVMRSGIIAKVECAEDCFSPAPCGPYPEPPKQAIVLPIAPTGAERPMGYMVAGLSSRLPLTDVYQSFVELVANTVTAAAANARAYEEERKRAEALAKLDQAKTTFFSNVSHEFRTPLTLMLGPLEDALADCATTLPEIQHERLRVSHRNALRLLKLVNTLLDFSRIEAGRANASFEPIDLALATAELASHFHSACEKAGLQFVVDCPPLHQTVYVDRDMWEKIVLNLLSNAFKFTLSGEIAIRLRTEGNRAELTVRDTGTGIPPEEMPRLFERFHRIEGAQGRTYEGSGIGLAMVQELVKLHEGTIWAESTLGQGTTFHVSIPLGCAHLSADRLQAAPKTASTAQRADSFVEEALRWLPDSETGGASHAPAELHGAAEGLGRHGSSPRVLLADDNADMRDYICRILRKCGCTVETVSDGEAALAAARTAILPDMILTDVMMPRLDGFGLVRALRADPRTASLPVILLSARAGEEARVEGLAAGADDYLVKPFSGRELVARVEGSLRLTRLRREKAEAERVDVEQALGVSEERLGLALDSARMGMWDWDLLADELTCSPMCKAIFGKAADAPMSYQTFLGILHPDDRGSVDALCSSCLDPAHQGVFDTQYRVIWPNGSTRWVMARGKVFFQGERPIRFTGTTIDITDQKEAEVNLRTLVDELSHRVKNTLAVVQSISEQTFKTGSEVTGIRQALAGRLQALADTHTLLTLSKWESVDLATQVERAVGHLASNGDSRFTMKGPAVKLTPKASLALGLVLHELSTNAAKHGAWARDGGSVTVVWHLAGGKFVLEWHEAGMDGLTQPKAASFGTRLITQAVEYDLDGEILRDFRPTGLYCALMAPEARVLSAALSAIT